jgi:hypothetical protein
VRIARSHVGDAMRHGWLGTVLLASAALLPAETPITVEALTQLLAAQNIAQKKDAALADKLARMELSERLSAAELGRLETRFQPKEKTAQMLELLADRSAFLALPKAEILARPMPDHRQLQNQWDHVVHDTANALRQLPNFMATRATRGYDNVPNTYDSDFALRPRSEYRQRVTYRDGHDAPDTPREQQPLVQGLLSSGEFGGLLLQVLHDIPSGTLRWGHWESTDAGDVMVLRYEIPANASHFHVQYFCCSFTHEESHNFDFAPYAGAPAYHGEIAIDPNNGDLRRLTVVGDFLPVDALRQGGIAIDYRRVEIGGKSYLCPVHSVALLTVKARQRRSLKQVDLLWINEVRFSDYHRLGAEVRILPD